MRAIHRLLAFILPGAALLIALWSAALVHAADLPQGAALPIRVNLAVRLLDVVKISETAGEMSASLEYTARWHDRTQRFDPIATGSSRRDFTGEEAKRVLEEIWTPRLLVENLIDDPRNETTSLSVFSDGAIVLIHRLEADFRIISDLAAFPFDRQTLVFPFASEAHPADEVVFVVDDRDRELSTFAATLTASDWTATSMRSAMETFYGWNARPFVRASAKIVVERAWPRYFLRIFVPFVAVLTVSLFILWASRTTFSDTIGITYSALLALAALSFTFEGSFPGSMSVNSPIAFMISLGYFYLIFVLLVDLLMTHEKLPGARRNPCLTAEVRAQVRYALPIIFTTVCVCIILRSLA